MSDGIRALVLGAALAVPGAEGPAYDVPEGAYVLHLTERADGVVAAIYVEPFDPWCGVGAERERLDLMRVAVYDGDGRRLWRGRVPPLAHIQAAYVLPSTVVVVWGVERDRGPAVFRLNAVAPERLVGRAELDGGVLTAVEMDAEGGILIKGTFTSVRGRPRPGIARFRPNGSLDD